MTDRTPISKLMNSDDAFKIGRLPGELISAGSGDETLVAIFNARTGALVATCQETDLFDHEGNYFELDE